MQFRRSAAFAALWVVWCAGATAEVRRVSILHTNDLHARVVPDNQGRGGFAYLAGALRAERAGCGHCLHLSAGDLVQGMPVSAIFRGVPVFEMANGLGIDAFALGNHEFDYGWRQVESFRKAARFPLLAANAVLPGGRTVGDAGWVILKVNGVRVGVIGVAMGDLVEGFLTPTTAGPVTALPVVESVRAAATELHGKADVIVVVGHIHQHEGSAILRQLRLVAAVVEGHNHRGRETMEEVDGRAAVGLRGYGTEIGRLELDVDLAAGRSRAAGWRRIPVTVQTVQPARDVAREVARWERKVAGVVDQPVGEARREFAQAEVRELMERAMREEMGADVSHMNLGGVRDKLPKGVIRERELWNIMPFDNQMVVGRMKGRQINARLGGGRPLEAEREYVVTLGDYSVENEAQRRDLGVAGVRFEKTERTLRQVLIDWVRKKKVLE
ncbi:MAG: bifunctional metallophosphatase/5'-nucleotidase [Acidobacteria bacterium]|nr:bifunctional metallophosphatase/5'-nucleotidase [Acidobacteriota bacterium]